MNPGFTEHWQTEKFYNNNALYFEEMLLAIALAKTSIDLEVYIFNYDSLGKRFINALSQARQRGVAVRVIIDGIGSVYHAETVIEAFAKEGIECRVFHPLPWQFTLFDNAVNKGNFLAKILLYLKSINHRDHRKVCIIDGVELWSGSLNITQSHYGKDSGGDGRIDFGVLVTGPTVEEVTALFERFWNNDCEETVRERFRNFLSNHTLKARLHKNQQLIDCIDSADKRIWLCSAYFSPSGDIIRALVKAAKRGMDVKIVVPVISDFAFFPVLTSNYYKGLLETGIEVYEFQESFLHAKALLLDDYAIIGSTNLNYRSLFHDLELDIVLQQSSTVEQIETSMKQLFAGSKIIKHHRTRIHYRWFRKILYWLRYWL